MAVATNPATTDPQWCTNSHTGGHLQHSACASWLSAGGAGLAYVLVIRLDRRVPSGEVQVGDPQISVRLGPQECAVRDLSVAQAAGLANLLERCGGDERLVEEIRQVVAALETDAEK
jgi:hypothetical protein